MIELTDKDKSEYFHRSYKTADGLWFVKTEERFDFNVSPKNLSWMDSNLKWKDPYRKMMSAAI